MRRRMAAVAGAAAITAFAATVGLGANFGLFGLAQPESRPDPAVPARSVGAAVPDPAADLAPAAVPSGALRDD